MVGKQAIGNVPVVKPAVARLPSLNPSRTAQIVNSAKTTGAARIIGSITLAVIHHI